MGGVRIAFGIDDSGYSAGVEKIRRQNKQLVDGVKDIERQTVSSMQASSAAIRLLEGGMTGNIRAAERFIGTIPLISKALEKAFPLVGGIAFAGVLARIGEEAAKAIQKVAQSPQVIANAFREMTLSAETAIDTTKLSTAKMQEQIALLTGQRPNTLAIDLAEASLAADKLATSLDADNKKIAELLKSNGLSALSGFLGKAGTAEVGGSVNSFDQQMSDLAARMQHATRTGDSSGAAALQKQLDDKRNAALAYANSQIAQRSGDQGIGGLNQDANLSVLTGFRNTLVDQGDQEQAEKANKATAAQLKRIQDAQKYAEEMKKAQAQLLKVYEDQERQQNAFNRLTVNEEIQFWSNRISAFTKGGEAYLAVQNKIYEEIAKRPDLTKVNKENQANIGKSQVEGNDLLANASKAMQNVNLEAIERAQRITQQFAESSDKAAEAQMKFAAAFRESSIAIALEQGGISRLQAAQALAASHAQEHADALAEVNRQLQQQIDLIQQTPDSKMSPDDKQRSIDLANQQAQYQVQGINDNYAIQQQQDKANVSGNTIAGAQRDALNKMVQSWDDLAANLKQLIPQTMDSLNDNIVKAMTGQKTDFGKTFTTAGQGFLKAALEKVEGTALGAAGLGKPDGSQMNPIWTRDASQAGGGPFGGILGGGGGQGGSGGGSGGGFLSKILGMFGGGGGAAANAVGGAVGDAGGGAAGGLSGLIPEGMEMFQGAFAGGGDVLASRPALVGERGPEVFMPKSAGTIIPNHALGGGNHTHLHFNIQGNQDPAAVEAAIRRATPHIAAATMQAQHSHSKRTPHGR